jgi:hypothetical protein
MYVTTDQQVVAVTILMGGWVLPGIDNFDNTTEGGKHRRMGIT